MNKSQKEVVFRKVGREEIDFFRTLMKNPVQRNLPLEQKQKLVNQTFHKQLSRSTVYKIQRRALKYTHKRITNIRPVNNDGKLSHFVIYPIAPLKTL